MSFPDKRFYSSAFIHVNIAASIALYSYCTGLPETRGVFRELHIYAVDKVCTVTLYTLLFSCKRLVQYSRTVSVVQ